MPTSKTKSQIGPDHYRYYADLHPQGVTVHCERFVVIGETERCWYVLPEGKTYLLGQSWGANSIKEQRKRVLKASHGRRYCYPSKAHALESFKQRQKWRMAHANRNIAIAELALSVVEPALENLATAEPQDKYRAGQNEYTRGLSWGDY